MSAFPRPRHPRPAILATALCAILAAPPVLAEASVAAATEAVDLDAVVVTAAGYEQKLVDAPASISVISQADLRQRRYSNLAQALADVEGIDINQGTGKTGGLNISIRGMPSAYTLVLIDGRRQNNSGDITPNGFGETSNSFMPPMSAIERIEVIRGPMSTLYGSDAMGGVVNIITRKVAQTWGASVGINHTLQEHGDYGHTRGMNVYANGPLARDLLGLAVRGSWFDRGPSELEFADGSNVSRRGAAATEGRNYNLGTRLTFTPHQDHELSLDLERGRQTYNNDDCQLGTLDGWSGNAVAGCTSPSVQAAGYAQELRFNRDQVVLAHRARLGQAVLDSSLTHKATETVGRTVPGRIGTAWTGFPGIVGGAPRTLESTDLVFDTRLVMPLAQAHTFSVGAQWLDAEVVDGLATEEFSKKSWSLFAEDEWRLRENLGLTFGGRYEDHEAFGGHFSPRAYLVWNASGNWTVKGGVSEGYRVPTVNQLHDGINGASGQGTIITIGSPDLKPETSTNAEIGVYFDNLAGFNANLTVFRTDYDDMISGGTPIPNCWSATRPGLPGCMDLGNGFTQDSFAQSINIDRAQSRGAELAARWQFHDSWSVSGNYTWTDTEQKSGIDAGAPVTNQARHIANAKLDWEPSERFNFFLRGEYYGDRDRFTNLFDNLSAANQAIVNGLGPLKAYHQFHLGGSYRASDHLTFNATVYNLLDKDFLEGSHYTTHTGATAWGSHYAQIGAGTVGTIQEGRRLWLSVNVDF
ncbi:MAG: TonB-dependent receptor [Pseudoxanthomonas sp.]|nr:TonB-dependent receptor [Pseudoxanthomonas sp.]MBP9645462.1 TonB-dependent receptor [Pseudoxanthomonas sp.]